MARTIKQEKCVEVRRTKGRKDRPSFCVYYIVYMAGGKQRRERVGVLPPEEEVLAFKDRPTTKRARNLLKQRRDEVDEARLRGETWLSPKEKEKAAAKEAEKSRAFTVGKLFTLFFAEYTNKKTGKRPRSNHYEGVLKAPGRFFGALPAKEITDEDPARYSLWRREDFMRENTPKPPKLRKDKKPAPPPSPREISDSTLRKELTALGTVFRWAVTRKKLLPSNPFAECGKPEEPEGKVLYLQDQEEWLRVKAELSGVDRLLGAFSLGTGTRLKEAASLTWQDIDWKAGMLDVGRNGKTGKGRRIPMGKTTKELLMAQPRLEGCPFVFTDAEGLPLTSERERNGISQRTAAAMKRAGVIGGGFHTLRHTWASWAVQAGVPLYEVQKVLGHRSSVMTEKYAHLRPGHLQGAMDAVDAEISAGGNQVCHPGMTPEVQVG